jgi:hypothetical protein
MLMTSVVEPAAFSRACFDTPGYKEHVWCFLMGVKTNGLVIVDREGVLLRGMRERLESLPTSQGQRICGILEEFVKESRNRGRKRIIECDERVAPADSEEAQLLLAARLARAYCADAVVRSGCQTDQPQTETLSVGLDEYSYSEFENRRKRFCEFPSIDQLERTEVEDALIRCVRFSKWLRFYDAYIGRAENPERFLKGLEFIIRLWTRHAHFTKESVEIFTFAGPGIDAERHIAEPLRNRCHPRLTLRVKSDSGGRKHPRYLQTETAVVQFDHGFDLFNSRGSLRENILTNRNIDCEGLERWRRLADVS